MHRFVLSRGLLTGLAACLAAGGVLAASAPAVAAPVAAAPAAAAPGTTSGITFTSEAGEWVGGGVNEAYLAPAARVLVSGTAEKLSVQADDPTGGVTAILQAPVGEQLHPGRYRDAERAGMATGRSPGLEVSGYGRGCGDIWGSFDIDQITVDAAGAVTRLEASFVQRCESATAPALRGHVYLNVRPQQFGYTSEAGDPVGFGTRNTYLGATSTFDLFGTSTSLQFSASGERVRWYVSIRPPTGGTLAAGTFPVTGLGGGTRGTLGVSGPAASCNGHLTGTVTIREIRFDPAGQVVGLDASFVQRCEGNPAALRGTIQYEAGAFALPAGTA